MLGRIDVGCMNGGSGSEMYVYAQKNEPESKVGVWIKTEATGDLPEIDKITLRGVEIVFSEILTKLPDIPYDAYNCKMVEKDNDIYFFSGLASDSGDKAYITYTKKNSTIYLGVDQALQNIKISSNYNTPKPFFASIAQNNTFLNYPAYYGDCNSWQLLNT